MRKNLISHCFPNVRVYLSIIYAKRRSCLVTPKHSCAPDIKRLIKIKSYQGCSQRWGRGAAAPPLKASPHEKLQINTIILQWKKKQVNREHSSLEYQLEKRIVFANLISNGSKRVRLQGESGLQFPRLMLSPSVKFLILLNVHK